MHSGKRGTRNNFLGRSFCKLLSKAYEVKDFYIEKKRSNIPLRTEIYSDDNFNKLVATALEHKDNMTPLFLRVGRKIGLRKIELFRMKKKDINFENGEIKIYGKGGRVRYVVLGGQELQDLKDWCQNKDIESYIFIKGVDYDYPQQINFRIAKYCKKAQIPMSCPHVICRHSFATKFQKKVPRIELVQQALGHVDIKNTMRYVHDLDEQMREAWKKNNEEG